MSTQQAKPQGDFAQFLILLRYAQLNPTFQINRDKILKSLPRPKTNFPFILDKFFARLSSSDYTEVFSQQKIGAKFHRPMQTSTFRRDNKSLVTFITSIESTILSQAIPRDHHMSLRPSGQSIANTTSSTRSSKKLRKCQLHNFLNYPIIRDNVETVKVGQRGQSKIAEKKLNISPLPLSQQSVKTRGYLIHSKSFTQQEFILILEQLSANFHGEDFSVCMDNLMVHKSRAVKVPYKRLNITPIYNIPYCPDFIGMQRYFSMFKREYKSLLLQVLMIDEKDNVQPLIIQSLSLIDNKNVQWCVSNGLKCIDKQTLNDRFFNRVNMARMPVGGTGIPLPFFPLFASKRAMSNLVHLPQSPLNCKSACAT